MKIAIIGTAGIPAKYGGFETLTEYLTKELGEQFTISVYCSSKIYTDKVKKFNNSNLHYIPLNANGIQSIPYDIISLFNAAKSNDIILILGVSGCIILPIFKLFYPKKKLIINIDGLEHKREKWNSVIKKFLKFSERIAVKYGDIIISDNKEIQSYVRTEYNKKSTLIAYGGDHVKKCELSESIKLEYNLADNYAFKVCRIEPENNIEMILQAFSKLNYQFVIVGNWNKSQYGIELKSKYSEFENLRLLDAIYNQNILNQIRSNCSIYIHGHSAGGTNPSLVEAMNLSLPIFAFDVPYNRATTFDQAKYFKSSEDLIELISNIDSIDLKELGKTMKEIAEENYTWKYIASEYAKLFEK